MWEWINGYVLGVAVPWLLMAGGVFFSCYLGFFYVRRPARMLTALTERTPRGGVSPFRALTLALAGTLGVGNIVGVSAAIWMGGFGSILWMWVSALCAMVLKYAEIVLAMGHRRYDGQGRPHGAAMYYIRDLLCAKGFRGLGKLLAALFAILFLGNALCMGSVIQSEAVTGALEGVVGVPRWVTGILLAVGTYLVVRRGAQGISALTEYLVPMMTLGYLVLSVAVLVVRRDGIGEAFSQILSHAFTPAAGVGGVGGFFLSRAVRYGTMRGLVSNEAGCGTAPTAHAVTDGREPARQGVFGMVEVFVDTVLLCTLTALAVILGYDGAAAEGGNFIMMTVRAYGTVLGDFAAYFMSAAVLCFGFATILCWAHYGRESVRYLSRGRGGERGFVFLYAFSVLLGAWQLSDAVWQLTDLCVALMTLINVSVLFLGAKEIREETRRYFHI